MRDSSRKGIRRIEVCPPTKQTQVTHKSHKSESKLFLYYCSESEFSEEVAFALHLRKKFFTSGMMYIDSCKFFLLL